MDTIYLTAAFIPRICFVILFATAVGYLLSLKRNLSQPPCKSRSLALR